LNQFAFAQVTISLTVSENTPPNDSIFVAGTFNNWNPKASAFRLIKEGSIYRIVLPAGSGTAKFKFTRGSWETVEGTATGGFVPDRTFNYSSGLQLNLSVLGWEDKKSGGGGTGSTALPNVKVISDTFFMPELNRKRRIWIYLPNDYASSTKMYPVLYMHDGQNLFDNQTSFSGEWGIDEAMSNMEKNGYSGCIVVGVDNGGAQRLNEYSPFVNNAYGGGQGEAYAAFLVQTLKPYVDANYRTLADRANTLIAGSSMGGLISMFAAIKYPEVFSRVGVFSPAYWFSDSLFQFIKEKTISEPIRFFHISGANESPSMVALMQRYDSLLATEGYAIADRKLVVKSDGAHSEWFWKREFPEAFTWLISGPVGMQAGLIAKLNNATTIYPNPVQTTLSIKAEHIIDSVQLIDKLGQVLFTKKLNSNYYKLETIDFAKGNYILLFHAAGVYYSRQITLE
jgi:metallo-beta-lactamase class B